MSLLASGAGLSPVFATPAESPEIDAVETEEAAITPPSDESLAVTLLVGEGDTVARGAAVACLRHSPDICFVSPIAGRVARVSLRPGRRLSEIVIFREGDAVERHDPQEAETVPGLRRLMQASGLWPLIGRRPFGLLPGRDEVPAAIIVMAADTAPFAPDPMQAIDGQSAEFARGLSALARLTDGPVLVCGGDPSRLDIRDETVRTVRCGARHPQASPGIVAHRHFPAGLDTPVWDFHAEDVAALGALLTTGELPMTRLVRIAGGGLREGCLLHTHRGADLRQLTQRLVAPGPHKLMSGTPLTGAVTHWLGPRDRQVTVLPREDNPKPPHWLIAALTRSATARPAIPSAALSQALAGALPAAPFIRALSAGDDEAAMRMGVLSLLEEDMALADYVLSEGGHLRRELRAMLDRIRTEFAA